MKTIKTILEIIESGVANLQQNENVVNELNVFPVPDGDTGSNMLSTMYSGLNEAKYEFSDDTTIEMLLEHFSKGCLLGARGNSGVITSQIFKGLFVGFQKASVENKNLSFVKNVLHSMKEYAYNSVPKPVEGTILSVIGYVADKFQLESSDSLEIINEIVRLANIALENTPNQLPILKESGVVDSGGKGITLFFEGVQSFFQGRPIKLSEATPTQQGKFLKADPFKNIGYCSEFIMSLKEPEAFDKDSFLEMLSKMGDSIVLIKEDDILKVHVHVKNPGELLNKAQPFGEFSAIKIENMTTQVEEMHLFADGKQEATIEKEVTETSELGIIAVATGEGIAQELKEHHVDVIINGGQTMNPSVNDFVDAINSLPNSEIVIFPNNSNVIMSAKAAKELVSDKKVYVIETKSIQQGIAASYNINKGFIPFSKYEKMIDDVVKDLEYGAVTHSIRDTKLNDVQINEGEFMTLVKNKILDSNKDLLNAAKKLVDELVTSDKEIITILYNDEAGVEVVEQLEAYLETLDYDLEWELKNGGQEVYYFLMFVE